MGGVIGFEHAAFHAVAREWGTPLDIVITLLPFAESGLLEGLADMRPESN